MSTKQGCFPTALRWLAIACCGLLLITLPLALLARSVSRSVFSPDLIKQELTDRLVDEGALRSAAVRGLLPEGDQKSDLLAALTADLTSDDWTQITQIAVPDDWVRTQMSNLVDDVFAWLSSDRLVPEIQLNVEPIKRNLVGAGTDSITAIVVESWPQCSLQQLFELEAAFQETGQIPLILCKPPEPIKSVVIGFVADAFRREARQLPATVDLGQAVQPSGAADLLQIKRTLRTVESVAGWGILIPGLLLGLIVALAVRSWRGLARWWGAPLLAGGLLTAITAAALLAWSANRLSADAVDLSASPLLLGAILGAVRTLLNRGLLRGALVGGLAAALGTVMLLMSWLLPPGGADSAGSVVEDIEAEGAPPKGMFG